jgi:hypothetical protein
LGDQAVHTCTIQIKHYSSQECNVCVRGVSLRELKHKFSPFFGNIFFHDSVNVINQLLFPKVTLVKIQVFIYSLSGNIFTNISLFIFFTIYHVFDISNKTTNKVSFFPSI